MKKNQLYPIASDHTHIADSISTIQNSVELFVLKYGKYMDKNALDTLLKIQKASVELEKKLLK